MAIRRALIGAAVAAVLLAGAAAHAQAMQAVLIGGGTAGEARDLAARQICVLVNAHTAGRYDCVARTILGPAFAIRAVDLALLDFGLARSDSIREAFNGLGRWEGKPVEDLRSVFGLHPEPVQLVTAAAAAEALVYDLVRTVFERLDVVRSTHPAFRGLDPAAMVQGLTAPLHPGAARYYGERGWR